MAKLPWLRILNDPISDADRPFPHAVDQVSPHAFREVLPPLDLRHSATEYHSTQLIAEAFGLFGVALFAESLGQIEELLLFALFRFNAVLNQLHEHSCSTEPP